MSVYIVVGANDDGVKFCEAYAGVQSALGRAMQIASDFAGSGRIHLVDTSPKEEHMSDGSCRWVFMHTCSCHVMVSFRKIEVALPSVKDPVAAAPPVPAAYDAGWVDRGFGALPPLPDPPKPASYDFMDRSLPVGWTLDGKPAVMSDMVDNPSNIIDPLTLTAVQQKAIVTARIRKSPAWKGIPKNSPIAWFHQGALTQIERKTIIADFLIQAEIENLHSLREDLIAGTLKIV